MATRFETAGEEAYVSVPFLVPGGNGYDFVVPDPNSAEWNLRDHAGSLMGSWQTVPASGIVTVPSSYHTITRDIERRTLEYRWMVNGGRMVRSIPYMLAPRPVFDATPDQVRERLGVNRSELPDHEIDLISSYFTLAAALGGTVLRDWLDLGTVDTLRANRAIVLHAALELIPALRLKAAQTEKSGAEGFTRFDIDWSALEADLRRQLAAATASTAAGGSALFVLSNRADPFYA